MSIKKHLPIKSTLALVTVGVLALVGLVFSTSIFETNNAGYAQIKQAFYFGTLTVHDQPGTYPQLFGTIHTYKEASTFYFTADSEMGEARDQSIPFQFNDGAKSKGSGSIRVILPTTDHEAMITIHKKFKSMDGVMNRLVFPALRNAFFHTGPHMSAADSYAARRNEFASLVKDQLLYGTLDTEKEPIETVDEVTGKTKTVYQLKRIPCESPNTDECVRGFKRKEPSAFREFNIQLTNFVIDDIVYPKAVLAQIEAQRAARMNIITKEAEAKEADARAKKAEAEARAKVAETRATEEVQKTQLIVRAEASKAEAVLNAEKVKEVARLEKEAAEFEKKKQILLGEGEATRKRLVMQADGALQQKLNAWVKAQEAYAAALGKAQPGALVPSLMMGGGSGRGGNAGDLIELLKAKTAKDLSVDLGVRQK